MTAADRLKRVERSLAALAPGESCCALCPRNCRIDRGRGELGVCRTGRQALVSHALLHFGEEPAISGTADVRGADRPGRGRAGSGTVFFAGCNLKCLFCQNYQLSWLNEGEPVSDESLGKMMLDLQAEGALNINLVSPTHVVLPVLRGLRVAHARGLDVPLVWNSNGYENVDALQALDGVVDVYLPDLKYHSPRVAGRYSGAANYFDRASRALKEMSVQQPVLDLDRDGVARRGLIIRHLMLPGHVDETLFLLRWIKENLSPLIGLSLMSQYHPVHKAPPELRRTVGPDEYRRAADFALSLGFEHLFLQPEPFGPEDHLLPDFKRRAPFRWKK
ncbi:MAG: radical SAM protein [Candidatus Aminicenantes bacterium]|nr:radical SAM protein [Candidatus Aminicenantes bacterium]